MDARLPDAFLKSVVDLLPAQAPPGPQGGRPPVAHATVLKVIWFVLTVGCRWKDVPPELGCSRETARMRLKRWQETGLWLRIHHLMLRELKRRGRLELETTMIDSAQVRAFGGGDRSGPSPVDRRKPGTKYTVLSMHTVHLWQCRPPPPTSVTIARFFRPSSAIRRSAARQVVPGTIRRSSTPMPATTATRLANS